MAKSKKTNEADVSVPRSWTWLTGEKGLVNAPIGIFYDREIKDVDAKHIYKEAQNVAKMAEKPGLTEFIEKRLRSQAKHLVATAYYQQREIDGVQSTSKNIEALKAKKAKYEKLLAKLQEGAVETEDEKEDGDKK